MSLLAPLSKIVQALGFSHSVTKQKYLPSKISCAKISYLFIVVFSKVDKHQVVLALSTT